MKRIVDGKTYNTETATRVANSEWRGIDYETGKDEHFDNALYVTRGGAFFLHTIDRAAEEDIHTFHPMTRDEAHKWVMEGEVELLSDVFDEPPEAEAEEPSKPEATIYTRVPEPLKRQIESRAREADQSVNAWVMRCLEQCVGAGQTTMTMEERKKLHEVIPALIDEAERRGMSDLVEPLKWLVQPKSM